nr:hypothetical protein [uncultured Kingella sp.]
MKIMTMQFKESYRHSWIATVADDIQSICMFDLLKSEPIIFPCQYNLFIEISVDKIRKLHFIHNNLLGDIIIASPVINNLLVEYTNVQPIGVTLFCKDGVIEDYSIINTLQAYKLIDLEKSKKIYLTKDSHEYFISDEYPCTNIPNEFIIGRDIENRTRLFYSEFLVEKIKARKLDKYIYFNEL